MTEFSKAVGKDGGEAVRPARPLALHSLPAAGPLPMFRKPVAAPSICCQRFCWHRWRPVNPLPGDHRPRPRQTRSRAANISCASIPATTATRSATGKAMGTSRRPAGSPACPTASAAPGERFTPPTSGSSWRRWTSASGWPTAGNCVRAGSCRTRRLPTCPKPIAARSTASSAPWELPANLPRVRSAGAGGQIAFFEFAMPSTAAGSTTTH